MNIFDYFKTEYENIKKIKYLLLYIFYYILFFLKNSLSNFYYFLFLNFSNNSFYFFNYNSRLSFSFIAKINFIIRFIINKKDWLIYIPIFLRKY